MGGSAKVLEEGTWKKRIFSRSFGAPHDERKEKELGKGLSR